MSSIRSRVARNVQGWSFPAAMNLTERINFETYMENVFKCLHIEGEYFSLTPGHQK